ncbi:B- and T-lymphocyte attenuator [Lemmus lemmus]
MKTAPAMFGIPGLFSKFLILHVGFWSILGKAPPKRSEKPCPVQLRVLRHPEYATVGESFKMECPVTYCAQRPNVTWCKYSGGNCLPLEIGPRQHTGWEDQDQVSVFTLHFEPVHPSDNGSYSCSTDYNSEVMDSNIITLHVRGECSTLTSYSFSTVSDILGATNASGPPTMENRASKTWLFYRLLPLVALLLLLVCFCLVSFLKRHQGVLQFLFVPHIWGLFSKADGFLAG